MNINILMIGARGVGKTSTLTSMYSEFTSSTIGENLDIQLIASDETSVKLSDKLAQLKKQVDTGVKTKPTLEGSSQVDIFDFIIAKDERAKDKIHLKFRDFPGGYIKDKPTEVKSWIEESQIIVIPIDTPAMIEENGRLNEEINSPQRLLDIFKAIKSVFEEKRYLILFVPLKSEKYLDIDTYGTNNIVEFIENRYYKELIELFRQGKLRENVCIAITPIQTIGGVKFSRMEDNDTFVFVKKPAGKYEPKDTDQPLRYILSFAIKELLRVKNKGFFGWMGKLFSSDENFEKAVKSFSSKLKVDNNFKILQNDSFVK